MSNQGISVIEIIKPTQIVSGGYYMARGYFKKMQIITIII